MVTHHQSGIFALVPQTSFRGETSGSVVKCRLFSQATTINRSCDSLQCTEQTGESKTDGRLLFFGEMTFIQFNGNGVKIFAVYINSTLKIKKMF